jgi:hypothetical protein
VSAVFMMWSAGGQQQVETTAVWLSALYLNCCAHSSGSITTLRFRGSITSGGCLKACQLATSQHGSRCQAAHALAYSPSMALSRNQPLRHDAVALLGSAVE